MLRMLCKPHSPTQFVGWDLNSESIKRAFIYYFYECGVCVCSHEFMCIVCVKVPVEDRRGCWIPEEASNTPWTNNNTGKHDCP